MKGHRAIGIQRIVNLKKLQHNRFNIFLEEFENKNKQIDWKHDIKLISKKVSKANGQTTCSLEPQQPVTNFVSGDYSTHISKSPT